MRKSLPGPVSPIGCGSYGRKGITCIGPVNIRLVLSIRVIYHPEDIADVKGVISLIFCGYPKEIHQFSGYVRRKRICCRNDAVFYHAVDISRCIVVKAEFKDLSAVRGILFQIPLCRGPCDAETDGLIPYKRSSAVMGTDDLHGTVALKDYLVHLVPAWRIDRLYAVRRCRIHGFSEESHQKHKYQDNNRKADRSMTPACIRQ